MGITHLCFADDLMLLCHADKTSASILRRALDEFSLASGLYPSIIKSTIYFGNVPNDIKCSILMFMPFNEGTLPAKYLGVPLVSRKLYKDDCKFLIDYVTKRLTDWRNRFLSYDGRLQLIASILSSLQVYWASIFILPLSVCEVIDKLFKNFLWAGSDKSMGIASVAWKDICKPKRPLSRDISHDTITAAHFSLCSKVKDMVSDSDWIWPTNWYDEYKDVLNVPVPNFNDNVANKAVWVNRSGKEKCFSVKEVWKGIRSSSPKERNFRLFRKCERTNDKLFSIVTEIVRLKLMGLYILKASSDVKNAAEIWNFPLKIRNWRRDVSFGVFMLILLMDDLNFSLKMLMELLKSAKLLSLWKTVADASIERPCTLFLA
ncbi:hypothetical protein Tco_1409262 [Tanacetum coccineum]